MDEPGYSSYQPRPASGKNTSMIVAVIIGILLLLVGGGLFLATRSKSKPQESSAQTAESSPSVPSATSAMQKQSLKSLMAMSNQKCTFTDVDTGSSGTMYIGSGKARGDFSAKTTTGTMNSHMISTAQEVYFWNDADKNGFKMSMDSIDKMQQGASKSAAQAVDLNKQVDYQCSGWTVDNAMFTTPTNVTFTDYSKMMENMMNATKAAAHPSKPNNAPPATNSQPPNKPNAKPR